MLFDLFDEETFYLKKDREFFQYKSEDLVYIISPPTSQFRASSKKVSVKFVGPMIVHRIINPKSFLLCTLYAKFWLGLFEHERLKPTVIRSSQGNVTSLTQLKQVLHAGIKLN